MKHINPTFVCIGAVLALCIAASLAFVPGASPSAVVPAGGEIDSVCGLPSLPNPGVPGFQFPELETTVNGWVYNNNEAAMVDHGWGLWAALTMLDGKGKRTFQHWATPHEMRRLIKNKQSVCDLFGGAIVRDPSPLHPPRQHHHTPAASATTGSDEGAVDFWVSIRYNPTAAEFAVHNRLLDRNVLAELAGVGTPRIHDFPFSSIAIKPTYEVLRGSGAKPGKFKIPVWPGPPDSAIAFPPPAWHNSVTIDTRPNAKRGPKTYPVSDFISYPISAEQAKAVNQENPGQPPARAGDLAVLVAMHVATREVMRWTWQSFWWSETPDAPHAPSNILIAHKRPRQLDAAARHYSMVIGYSMVAPAQPVTNGRSVGESVYCYNPYLEAGFGPQVFSVIGEVVQPGGKTTINNVGVRANCMSCHGLAHFDPDKFEQPPYYMGDAYFSITDPPYNTNKKLITDFLWSVPMEAEPLD